MALTTHYNKIKVADQSQYRGQENRPLVPLVIRRGLYRIIAIPTITLVTLQMYLLGIIWVLTTAGHQKMDLLIRRKLDVLHSLLEPVLV